jgi:hypothetical protein
MCVSRRVINTLMSKYGTTLIQVEEKDTDCVVKVIAIVIVIAVAPILQKVETVFLMDRQSLHRYFT